MAKTLTAKAIENAKPGAVRREIPDAGCKGLYFVLQPSGARSWAVRYRHDGRTRKFTLVGFPTLAVARQQATAALVELEQGRDPAAAKFEARNLAAQADAERKKNTVEQLAARFLEQHGKTLRPASRRQLQHVFRTYVLPAWAGRNITEVRRRDVRELVEGIAGEHVAMANRTLGWVGKFFAWLCERDIIEASPCAGVKRPGREQPRDRVLDPNEIKNLWLACDAVGGPGAALVKAMLLLGQRRNEIAGMRRSEIEGDLWRIPAARMKGRAEHIPPLSARALAIIEAQPVINGSDFVFTVSGERPYNDFARLKQRLDGCMRPQRAWRLHDIRRTLASGLAGLGVPVATVEKILGHRSGTFAGIVSVYQKHSFVPEMRNALERWSEHVEQLVSGTGPAKVIQIDRRR
jgi:integrase